MAMTCPNGNTQAARAQLLSTMEAVAERAKLRRVQPPGTTPPLKAPFVFTRAGYSHTGRVHGISCYAALGLCQSSL